MVKKINNKCIFTEERNIDIENCKKINKLTRDFKITIMEYYQKHYRIYLDEYPEQKDLRSLWFNRRKIEYCRFYQRFLRKQ